MSERAAALAALDADLLAQHAELSKQFDEIVQAAESSNLDDEHDPEGATIGFERAQVAALIGSVSARLTAVHAAQERLARDEYGQCLRCGERISPERLTARPEAAVCVACAGRETSSMR